MAEEAAIMTEMGRVREGDGEEKEKDDLVGKKSGVVVEE